MRNHIIGALAVALSLPIHAQSDVPYSRPLHIQRIVHDPISRSVSTIDEYYVGNQVIAVRGDRVVIVDRQKRTLTEVDRSRSSWSESALSAPLMAEVTATRTRDPRVRDRQLLGDGTLTVHFENHEVSSIRVDTDRRIRLSSDAVAAIVGGSSPTSLVTRVVIDAAGDGEGSAFLPSRIERRFEVAGEELILVEELRFVAWEAPPAELLRLPEGARRELSRADRLGQALADIEEPRQ